MRRRASEDVWNDSRRGAWTIAHRIAASIAVLVRSQEQARMLLPHLVAAGVPSVDSLEGDLPGEDLVVKTVVDRDAAPSDWGSDWR